MDQPQFNHTGYKQQLAAHKLMGSRCANCGAVYLPPRVLCTQCFATQMDWYEFSGQGEVVGFTIIYVGLSSKIAEGFTRDCPYGVAVIRLVEGPSISGQILSQDCTQLDELSVGMPVRAEFIDRDQGQGTLLAFVKRERMATERRL